MLRAKLLSSQFKRSTPTTMSWITPRPSTKYVVGVENKAYILPIDPLRSINMGLVSA